MNDLVANFSQWMKMTTGLSDSSIYKYSRAVISVSKATPHNCKAVKNMV